MSNQNIILFENRQVRRYYDAEKEIWYFSIVDIVEALKNIVCTIILIVVAYFTQKGRIDKIELRLDNKKARLDKLESQNEIDTKSFQDLTRSIDRLNFHFENLEKRLDKSETK